MVMLISPLHNLILCQHRAAVNALDHNYETPLHKCCQFSQPHVIPLLLHARADLHAREKCNGRMPLHVAARSACLDAVQHLVLSQADINSGDSYSRTALHEACWSSSCSFAAVAQFLVDKGADADAVELMHAWTPLHVAARWGRSVLLVDAAAL
jgi:ankyrin repeat protein